MRKLILAVALMVSPAAYAGDCPELEIEGQRLSDAEEQGSARMRALLNRLQAARGWNSSKLLSYSVEVNSRGELPELQRQRQIHASLAASLSFDPAAKCSDIAAAFQVATATIEKQWKTVNAEIEKDLSAQHAP